MYEGGDYTIVNYCKKASGRDKETKSWTIVSPKGGSPAYDNKTNIVDVTLKRLNKDAKGNKLV